MKGLYLFSAAAVFLAMVLCPLLSMDKAVQNTEMLTAPEENRGDIFRLLDTETGTVSVVDAASYIYGVVASEMPAEYETEALKAQAVAAYTYACRKRLERADEAYDVTDSSASDQAYGTDKELKARFGDRYDEYTAKIKAAVDEVIGRTVRYDGDLALTVYHDISAGKTESAQNVWHEDFPYLVPVESPGDLLCPSYRSTVTVSKEDFSSAFADTGASLSGDADKWISEAEYSESGTVLTLTVGGVGFGGAEIRKKFGLKSAAFGVGYSDGFFTFTVHGHGHLVGMSQYGAQSMALNGSRYDEILLRYYPGCTVEK